jgi:membrane-bound lytic murein transglycosylase B
VKCMLVFVLFFKLLQPVEAWAAATSETRGLTSAEEQRKHELQNRLCKEKELSCKNVTALFGDPRLTIYQPPRPTAEQPPSEARRERERNPYFTKRFGLLTPESLERCRSFIQAHALTFAAAYEIYGVPKEIICGHVRIETDFGIPTKLSPHPLGIRPAINQLVTIYVRKPALQKRESQFLRRQEFAFGEIKNLIWTGEKFGWDLFEVPGSPTGAVGLPQFEPSSFNIAVDGDGDGMINLFDRDDAILSVAHYLVTRGWDRNPEHQRRAIYAYYGGHYEEDPNRYYMKAVLRYAGEVRAYLKDHPVESESTFVLEPLTLRENRILSADDSEHLPGN